MVENGAPLVEAPCVPRITKPEQVVVEVMAELMAQGAQECSVRCDFFLDGGSHPKPDEQGLGVVVAK